MDADILQMSQREFWALVIVLALCALAGLYFGFRWLRRLWLIEDTPTSRVRSAAQGYVELSGWGDLMNGEPIISPLSGKRCTWWRYRIEERGTHYRNGQRYTTWETIDHGVSDSIFLLCDNTGQCVIDPEHAEVTPSVNITWYGNSPNPVMGLAPKRTPRGILGLLSSLGGSIAGYRYTEMRMHPGDSLYAVGFFHTTGGISDEVPLDEDVRQILAEWKHDQKKLLEQFDTNHDGHIDAEEWAKVRVAARDEALAERRNQVAQSGVNILARPADGRPFILAAMDQDELVSRYRALGIAALTAFLGLGALAVYMLQVHVAAGTL